ncbi:MAG: hypothetical protein JWN04_569, partial [Myxococcaceae bacterium]|nr:hypothetical protein [Myxococcaceae bacterium]
ANEFVTSARACYQRCVPMPDGGRAGGLFAFLLLVSVTAHAQLPEQVAIEWKDDASCPRPLRLSLESEIARLLGPSSQNVEPSEFEAHIERLDDHATAPYRLTLQVSSETHRAERQMELSSCAEAQDAAALLIATAIDPEAVLRASAPVPKPPEPSSQREPPVQPHAWSLVARGLFDLFALPHPSGGPAVGVLLQRARFRAWGEARYLFARRVSSPPGDSSKTSRSPLHADVDLFSAVAGGAYVWPFGAWVVGPAAELELGALRSRGLGDGDGAPGLHRAAPWVAADIGAVAGYGVHRRVGLELSAFAGLPLSYPRLAVREEAAFYTTAPVTMRVAVGVRVSLGSL